jgi:hypothetical protein
VSVAARNAMTKAVAVVFRQLKVWNQESTIVLFGLFGGITCVEVTIPHDTSVFFHYVVVGSSGRDERRYSNIIVGRD